MLPVVLRFVDADGGVCNVPVTAVPAFWFIWKASTDDVCVLSGAGPIGSVPGEVRVPPVELGNAAPVDVEVAVEGMLPLSGAVPRELFALVPNELICVAFGVSGAGGANVPDAGVLLGAKVPFADAAFGANVPVAGVVFGAKLPVAPAVGAAGFAAVAVALVPLLAPPLVPVPLPVWANALRSKAAKLTPPTR